MIESYKILADKHHKKIWLLDLLIKVRTSTERLPCLDYETPLYYAVKSNNFQLVSLLMAYGYDKGHREEFEHCVIESIVTEQYKMALVLCEHLGIPIVVHIRRGYHIQSALNKHKTHHSKHSSMNKTRDRSGLLSVDEDDKLNANTFNPYVSVTVFEQTSQTDVIYNSDGSPLWNHYLLFIIPFSDIDEYIWLKQHAGDMNADDHLVENPLVQIRNQPTPTPKMHHLTADTNTNKDGQRHFSVESNSYDSQRTLIVNNDNEKTKLSPNLIIGLPMNIQVESDNEMPLGPMSMQNNLNSKSFHINGDKSPTFKFPSRRQTRGSFINTERRHFRNMSMTVGNLMSNGVIGSTEDNIFASHLSKKFVMNFKLYHHDYHSFDVRATQKKKKKKQQRDNAPDMMPGLMKSPNINDGDMPGLVKSPKGFGTIFTESSSYGDIELGHTNQNLFNYEQIVADQVRESGIKCAPNEFYGGDKNKGKRLSLHELNDIPMESDDDDADDDEDDDYKYMDKETKDTIDRITASHNSYEKMFTTVLNIRKRVLKGYRVQNACSIDSKIHLSALKCYEKFGLDYINKTKDELDGYDAAKYDEILKPWDPYNDYLLDTESDDDNDKRKRKKKKKKKKKNGKNTSRNLFQISSVSLK